MKAIKIVLGIISLVTLIFFSTGSFVKETNYTVEVTVNKPIKQVFELFNNPNKTKEWIPEIKSKTVATSNKGKTGSIYNIILDNQGQEIKMSEKIMAYVPNSKVTLFYNAENMLKTNDYLFTENSESTTILLNASCSSDSYIMACIYPYFKGAFIEQDKAYLNNFKAFIEKQ